MALLALLLAGQNAAAAAPDPVEVEIAVDASADVPAQGYQVSAFFFAIDPSADDAGARTEAAKASAVAAIRLLGPVDRFVCASEGSGKFGFVGNEAMGGPDPEAQESDDIAVPVFLNYQVVLRDRQTADRAVAAMRKAGARNVMGPAPVLFDCAAGLGAARADALKRTRAQAESYATLMGLHVGGIRRVSQASGQSPLERLTPAAENAPSDVPGDKVRVHLPVTVTYLLTP